jgi:hypothetical protein
MVFRRSARADRGRVVVELASAAHRSNNHMREVQHERQQDHRRQFHGLPHIHSIDADDNGTTEREDRFRG